MEEAEKIAEEFFHRKKYEDFVVISYTRGYLGWDLTSRGQIIKSGKPRVDELKVVIDSTGKVISYDIKPGMEASSGKRKRD